MANAGERAEDEARECSGGVTLFNLKLQVIFHHKIMMQT